MKYVRIYVVVSIIYIPLTVYGTFKELRENSNLYVAVYNLIKNYFFCRRTILFMAIMVLVGHYIWNGSIVVSAP